MAKKNQITDGEENAKQAAKKEKVLSYRVDEALFDRIEKGIALTRLKKAPLLTAIIEAGLAAIEADRGLVVPVEFEARIQLVPQRVPAYREKKKAREAAKPTTAQDVLDAEDKRREDEDAASRARKHA